MSTDLFKLLPEGAGILFIRLRNLGEAVLDTANLRALKRMRPDLRIVTLVEAIYTDLYLDDPEIEALGLSRGSGDRRSSIPARLEVIQAIRRGDFTAVVNLHGGPTSAQLTFLSGARHRIGAAHFSHGYAYNLRIPPVDEILPEPGAGLHTVETQFAWFRWLGLADEEPGPTNLHVAESFRRAALEKLASAGIDPDRPYAVIAPTNEFHTKRWMPERFAAIADSLIERGFQIVMTGAPTEEQRRQLAAVEAATSNRLASLSRLSIGELVAVIAGSGLFVGNDSGPAHIAAAVKTPQVVLFGPASSVRWRPWRAPAELVQNHFDCNPCHMYRCDVYDEPECIRSISVEQVQLAIDRLLI
ncbi:MAG: glycosyltransferase family 9 protein [Acidobacteriota bacterium]|nr:MAG: glycosyltransferase family 9 protein [Acidobacteriota bacterium]